jgi:hypothetical protein
VGVSKPVLVTLSVSVGLVASGGLFVLPTYMGAALTLGIAMLWCWWLERDPATPSNPASGSGGLSNALSTPRGAKVVKKRKIDASTSACATRLHNTNRA